MSDRKRFENLNRGHMKVSRGSKSRVLQARAEKASASEINLELSLLFVILLVVGGLISGRAAGGLPQADFSSLEALVFSSEEAALPQIEQQVTRAIQKNPRDANAHFLLSHLMVRKFSRDPSDLFVLKQASELAQQAIDLEPKNPVGYTAMASIFDVMSSPDRAIRLLEEAESAGIRPNWRFFFMRARLTAGEVGSSRVLELLDKALQFPDVQKPIVVPHIVAILQSEHSGFKLVQKLEDWDNKYPSQLFKLTKAIALSETGDFKNALKTYERILADEPDHREALINSSITNYTSANKTKLAIQGFTKVINRYESTMPIGMIGMVYAHLGAAQLKSKEFGEARRSFFKALEVDPQNVGILDFIAKTCRTAKAYDQLAGFLGEVSSKLAGLGVYHALLGETLSENLGRHDEAVKAFSNAIVLEPERGDYYNGMGLAFYRKQKFQDALKLFAIATEIDPGDANARYNEACVLALLGRGEEALATLAEAFSLDPRLVYTARSDHDLEGLKQTNKFWELVGGPIAQASQKISQ